MGVGGAAAGQAVVRCGGQLGPFPGFATRGPCRVKAEADFQNTASWFAATCSCRSPSASIKSPLTCSA